MRILSLLLAFLITGMPPRFEVPVEDHRVVQLNGNCSGFVAAPGYVFTAAHCIEDASAIQEVRFWDGMYAKFEVADVGTPDHRDWAILRGDTRGIEPPEFYLGYPEDGTKCISIGHGGGQARQAGALCEVRPPLADPEWRRYVAMSASVIGGDSGSLVMDRDGRVFGIVVRSSYPVPVSLAVKISLPLAALAKLQRQKITPRR